MSPKKITVLEKLLSDGVFSDAEEAKKWVMLGRVLADDVRVMSVHEKIRPDAALRVRELYKREFVGKGAFKLSAALSAFGVSVFSAAASIFSVASFSFWCDRTETETSKPMTSKRASFIFSRYLL